MAEFYSSVNANRSTKYYLIAFTPIAAIFFLIPFELYFTAREYWNWNSTIPVRFVLVGILVYLVLAAIISACQKISSQLPIYLSVCFFDLGIFILLADVFAPLQTNLLAGAELVSREPLIYSLIEAALFFLIIGGSVKLGPRSTISLAIPLSITLIVISVGYLGLVITSSKQIVTKSGKQNIVTNIQGNVYHIVLDEMQTDVAMAYLHEKSAKRPFSGFTMFPNNVSNYPYTDESFTSYFTGSIYTGGSFTKWKEGFRREGLLRDLYQKGYRITMYSPRHEWINPYVSEFVALDDIYEQEIGIKDAPYKDFIQIWFARLVPNFLTNEALSIGKKLAQFVYDSNNRSPKGFPITIYDGREPFSSVLMLKRLIKTEKERPARGQYIYAHAILPHGPYVLNGDCQYEPKLRETGREGYYGQVCCTFKLVIEFIEQLKRLGRYNDSTIIIHADTGHGSEELIRKIVITLMGTAVTKSHSYAHPFLNNTEGWIREQLLARSMALFMIKPAHSPGDLIFSQREAQLIDLYPTLIDLLHLPDAPRNAIGASLFKKDFPRERQASFFLYPPGAANPRMIKVVIADQRNLVGSKLIWADYVNRCFSFDIGSPDEGHLQLEGFSGKEIEANKSIQFRWAINKDSRIIFRRLPLPERGRMLVKFEIEPFLVNYNKEMLIRTALSQQKVILKAGWAEYKVILTFPEGIDPTLDIHYEAAASPESLRLNSDTRQLSVRWNKISLCDIPASEKEE